MPVGSKFLITAGLMAANMALTMSRKIEGPRLDDLKFTSGDYGAPLLNVWGMRRAQVPIFWAEDLKEIKRKRKTKGGKFNEYTYYGTWAVALAGHEIQSVRRIWFDTHLVFDLSGAGPVTPFDFGDPTIWEKAISLAGANVGFDHPNMSIYLGRSDQGVDGRMQATVEAKHGAGTCPAYRDTAYIVFKDVPLEKLGNRIPQVSVEIVGLAADSYPMQTLATGVQTSHFAFSYDYSMIAMGNRLQYGIVDTAARASLVDLDLSPSRGESTIAFAFMQDGTIIDADFAEDELLVWGLSGTGVSYLDTAGLMNDRAVLSVMDSNAVEHVFVSVNHLTYDFYFDGTPHIGTDEIGVNCYKGMIFATSDGEVWLVCRDSSSSTDQVVLWCLSGGEMYHVVTMPVSADSDPRAFHYMDATNDHFVVSFNGVLYMIDRATGVILDSYTPDYPSGISLPVFRAIRRNATSFWIGFEEIRSSDLTQIRLLDRRDWGSPGLGGQHIEGIYDPINHAIIQRNGSNLIWYYLDRVTGDGVPLSTIAGDVADWCGVEDYDFSDLTQLIPGWSATRGQASNMLEPLFDAYDSDIRPHDFTLQGIRRTGLSGGTILTERFVANDPRYTVKIRAAAELPAAVLINFADMDAEQQPATVRSDRPLATTDARGEMALDMTTLALESDDARALADRRFRRVWNERREATLALTAQQLALEPGDVRTLDLDGDELRARLVSLTIRANGVLDTEWKYDHNSLATLDTASGATFDGRDPAVITVPLISKGFVLDIPYLDDVDATTTPIAYVLAAPYADGAWPGATVYQSVDGEYSDELASVVSTAAADWGYVAEELPYTNPNVWDRGSTVTVTLQTGSLTGCTEAAIDADPTLNLAAIGTEGRWELVNFTTATLTGTRTYEVSGFKRGRRGTEWAAELHAAGDIFVLLDQAQDVAMGLSEVNTNLSFKALTTGRTTAFPIDIEPYTGASLKPYAPCHLEAVKDSSGDWTFTWIRRTRVGGAWTGGSTIPLSEDSEEYSITVGDGVSSDTKTVTSATYTWDVATQTADTGAEVMAGDLVWSVAQVSADVGDGFVADATA